MNMFAIVIVLFICFLSNTLIVCAMPSSKLEPYAKMISSKNFMIKYENLSKIPGPYIANPEALFSMDDVGTSSSRKKFMDVSKHNAYFVNLKLFPENKVSTFNAQGKFYKLQSAKDYELLPISQGVVVVKDNNFYSECGNDRGRLYQLSINDKSLNWKMQNLSYGTNKNKISYTPLAAADMGSDKSVKLEYTDYDIESEINYGINLGSAPITRYIYAMFPEADRPMTIPEFRLVKSTDEYEEYYSENDNMQEAVRYYFDGDKLTKIKAMAIIEHPNVENEIGQYVININEFTSEIDESYFKLPEYVFIKK